MNEVGNGEEGLSGHEWQGCRFHAINPRTDGKFLRGLFHDSGDTAVGNRKHAERRSINVFSVSNEQLAVLFLGVREKRPEIQLRQDIAIHEKEEFVLSKMIPYQRKRPGSA